MPPTDEQIRLAGGFQTPSSTSTLQVIAKSNGGRMNSSGPSDVSNLQLPSPFARSKVAFASHSDRPCSSIVPSNRIKTPELAEHPSRITLQSSPSGREEPSDKIGRTLLQSDSKWIPEVSWTEADIMEAAEFEQQADAAYFAQVVALRMADWVGRTHCIESPVTPFGQIKSSEVGGNGEYDGGFSGFSALRAVREAPSDKASSNEDGGVEEDPFETPGKRSSLPPQTRPDPPVSPPLIPESCVARRARRRGRHLSPCAYRSRSKADFLFQALQHEVSMN
jgi:hypothetical protein